MELKIVHEYVDKDGDSPYSEWLDTLESKARAKVISRIDRIELGHFGDTRQVDGEIYELRFRTGQRIYYVREGKNIYLLLCAGDKSSQAKDIKQARIYWDEHNS